MPMGRRRQWSLVVRLPVQNLEFSDVGYALLAEDRTMGFTKGMPKPPNSGRKRGVRNAVTSDAKQMFELAAAGAGGLPALTDFAKKKPENFWPLYAKLLPKNVSMDAKVGVSGVIVLPAEIPDTEVP